MARRSVAVVVGVLVGMPIAYFSPSFLWWVGVLAGATVAWAAYDFAHLWQAKSVAARSAWQTLNFLPNTAHALNSQDAEKRYRGWKLLSGVLLGLNILVAISFFAGAIWISLLAEELSNSTSTILGLLFFLAYFSILLPLFFVSDLYKQESDFRESGDLEEAVPLLQRSVLYLIPVLGGILVSVYLVKYTPTAFRAAARHGPRVCMGIALFIARFMRALYLLTHSHMRWVVALDTAVAIGFGYIVLVGIYGLMLGPTMTGSLLLGAFLGAFDYDLYERFVKPRIAPNNGNA